MIKNDVMSGYTALNAVILSAGLGTRMYPRTKNIPKCLISIKGEPLLKIQTQLLRDIGVENIVIVIGGKGSCWTPGNISKIKSIEKNIIINPINDITGNAYSFYLSRNSVDQDSDLIILDGDLYFDSKVLSILCALNNSTLIVRRAKSVNERGGRIVVENEYVKQCSRDLIVKSKIFYIFSGLMLAKANIVKKMYNLAPDEPGDVLNIVNTLCKDNRFLIQCSNLWKNINDEKTLLEALKYVQLEKRI